MQIDLQPNLLLKEGSFEEIRLVFSNIGFLEITTSGKALTITHKFEGNWGLTRLN